MREFFTKTEMQSRGWSEERIKAFAGKRHAVEEKTGDELWGSRFVQAVERHLSFKSFGTQEELQAAKARLAMELDGEQAKGAEYLSGLKVEFDRHDCLAKNKDKYDFSGPVSHLVKKDFNPDPAGSYCLFTDGSFKAIGKKAFASCAGWILDRNCGEIVAEFSDAVPLDPEAANGMPDFELVGIHAGLRFAESLGVRNFTCYTDSFGESKVIAGALLGLGDGRYNEHEKLYSEAVDILRRSSGKIAWIPRELNAHADELAKLPIDHWYERSVRADVEEDYVAKHGYAADPEKEIYFHHSDLSIGGEGPRPRLCLACVYFPDEKLRKKKGFATVLHDASTGTFEILEFQPVGKPSGAVESGSKDAAVAVRLAQALSLLTDAAELAVMPSNGIMAVCKKLTPMPGSSQEAFFELHRAISKFKGTLELAPPDASFYRKALKAIDEFVNGPEPAPKAATMV